MSHHHHHGDGGHHHHHHGPCDGGHGEGGDQHHHHEGGGHPGGGEHRGPGGGHRPGPRNVDLELSQMLGDRAAGMTRELFMEVLRDAIKDELRKLPEVQALVAQAARELSEDMRLSLRIEELVAERDKKREGRKADLLSTLLGKDPEKPKP